MNALIIEPDYLLANIYKTSFEKHNFKVQICYEAQDAIKKIDQKKPDAIIIEMQLAGHSGSEFLHEFRSYEDWQEILLYVYTNIPERVLLKNKKIFFSLNIKRYFNKSKTPIDKVVESIIADIEQ
jgi:DNA-binding response OmpR family regulator